MRMKPGRNDPCSCGSGKKYKNCCLGKPEYHPTQPSSIECGRLLELSAAKRFAELESHARSMAAQYPNSGFAWKSLGESLYMQGKDALHALRKATEFLPNDAVVFNNLGTALQGIGHLGAALDNFRRALQIRPKFAEAHNNVGNVMQDLARPDEAVASYRRALEIRPDYVVAQARLLFTLNYTDHSPEYHLEEALKYGRMVDKQAASRFSSWQCTTSHERLRVGLVSGDFRIHSVGFFLEGLLAHIDPARVELIAYPTRHKEDELTARIKPFFSAWKPLVNLSDEAAARLIHADGVHVLIDLSGHTAHNRLPVFAWKPAPVQVTWLGLPATTGVAQIDYVLGDPQAIPPGDEDHFTETVWRLPDSYVCFSPPTYPLKVSPLPALTTGQVTFGSFNNPIKMNDAVVAVWARILNAVPGSRLLLKAKLLSAPDVCEMTRKRFASHGIAPKRLLLSQTIVSRDEHLAAYNKVDIALDTFPYPGVTTSVEALWMGVPVLSLQGDRFLSRTAGSIAHNAGLPDWVAADEDDYVAKAVAFASDLESLAGLRAGLRQQVLASPLFDAPRFARNFEEALWGMWQARTPTNIANATDPLAVLRD
jgi:protein O-GlcNAc transferase